MNTLQIASILISAICLIITTVVAWVMLYRVNKTEVSFTGTPVDKKDFEKHVEDNDRDFDNVFAKIGGAERGVEKRINERIVRLEESTEKIYRKMESDKSEILKTGEDRTTNTHERINEVLKAVSELTGEVRAGKH